MISKIKERVGSIVLVFLLLLVVMIAKMSFQFNELDFLYSLFD